MSKEMKIYHDNDVSSGALKGKTIAVIGFGIQGAAQAQCWHKSGYKVVVGLRKGSPHWDEVKRLGMEAAEVADAAKKGDVVCMLIPDMAIRQVYKDSIAPHLSKGKALYFSHGLNVTYKLVQPPKDVDVIMVAPKGPGAKVLETYEQGFGTPALFAVHQDASGSAREKALELAKGLHATRAGVFEATFDQETFTDLFGEQTVLCGGSVELVKAGFETLVERGYPPEMAYFEVLHELKLITDLVQKGGLEYMWDRVSETARYGGRTRGKRIITAATKKEMGKVLDEIESGQFAKEWLAEYDSGMPLFKKMKEEESRHPIEVVGAKIRSMFQIGK